MTRTDVHSPKRLVTEDYEYRYAIDNQTPWALDMMRTEQGRAFQRSLMNFTDELADRGTHQCHHCGAHIRYAAFLQHMPTGKMIVVGETCLDNRFDRATADFQRMRKAAQLDRETQRIKTAATEWLAGHPEVAWLDRDVELPEAVAGIDFIHDLRRKLYQYGDLSDRQAEAAARVLAQARERQERRAAEADEVKVPAPEGRRLVCGEVVSTRWQEGDWGAQLKMLVKVTEPDGVWRLWTTVPRALDVERGDEVAITVTVQRSRDDESFAFGSRPTYRKQEVET
jgi:hypothetical protein